MIINYQIINFFEPNVTSNFLLNKLKVPHNHKDMIPKFITIFLIKKTYNKYFVKKNLKSVIWW